MRNVLCNALKPAVLATAAVAVCGLTAEAATVSLSTATPAVGAGVENLTLSTSQSDVTQVQYSGNYLAGDTGVAVGQTFTTGSNAGGYILSAISVHQIGSFNTFYDYTGGTITAQVFQTGTSVGGGVQNIVPLSTETASVGGEDDGMTYANGILGANAQWLTITLATPLTLLPNTQYGFQLASSGTTGNDGFFMELDGTNTNPYAGGYAIGTSLVSGAPDPAVVYDGNNGQPSDRAFVATMSSVVPEPASLALCGLAGLGMLRRRRA